MVHHPRRQLRPTPGWATPVARHRSRPQWQAQLPAEHRHHPRRSNHHRCSGFHHREQAGCRQGESLRVWAVNVPSPLKWWACVEGKLDSVAVNAVVSKCSPHASGDHPKSEIVKDSLPGVRPTRVGITPSKLRRKNPRRRSPHASGDHPTSEFECDAVNGFAPREWGSPHAKTK